METGKWKKTLRSRKRSKGKKEVPGKKGLPLLHQAKQPYTPPVPYPQRMHKGKQDKQFSNLYNMLFKVEINLPLLEIIRNVPTYAKKIKDFMF